MKRLWNLMLSKVRKVWKLPASQVLMESLFKVASMLLTDDQGEVDSEDVDVDVAAVGETTVGRRRAQKPRIEVTRRVSMTLSLKRSHVDREVVITEVVVAAAVDVVAVEDIAVDQDQAAKALETSLALMEMTTMKGIALVKAIDAKAEGVDEATQVDDHDDSEDVHDVDHHKALETRVVGTAIMTTAVTNTRKVIAEIEVTEMTPAVVVIVETEIEIEIGIVMVSVIGIIVMVATVMAADPDVADMGVTGKL